MDPGSTLPYARQPRWRTGLTPMRAVLIAVLAALLAGAIVLPRVLWRGQFLMDQRHLLDYTPAENEVALSGDAMGVWAMNPLAALRRYERYLDPDYRPERRPGTAFVGRRTAGGVDYLVIVRIPPFGWLEREIHFAPSAHTIAGWSENPEVIPGQRWQQVHFPVGSFRVIRGQPDQDDPTIFRFFLEHDEEDGQTTRHVVVGYVEPGGRVRLEMPELPVPDDAAGDPNGA